MLYGVAKKILSVVTADVSYNITDVLYGRKVKAKTEQQFTLEWKNWTEYVSNFTTVSGVPSRQLNYRLYH